jgi:putative redox protein
MEVTVNWKGKMAFEGTAASGHMVQLDSDIAGGGEDSAARPTEFIALGLAGCTGMDVISILGKKQQAVKDFEVKVYVDKASDYPKVFTKAVIEYLITGKNIDEAAVLRAIGLSVEKYCPVYAMLSKAFPIELRYKIFEEEGHQLQKEGSYEAKLAGS